MVANKKSSGILASSVKQTSIFKHFNDSSAAECQNLQGEESPSERLHDVSTRNCDVCYDFPVDSKLVGGGKCVWACQAKSILPG